MGVEVVTTDYSLTTDHWLNTYQKYSVHTYERSNRTQKFVIQDWPKFICHTLQINVLNRALAVLS